MGFALAMAARRRHPRRELGPDRPGQRVPSPHDILKLVKRDCALAPVMFLQPARQGETIQQVGHSSVPSYGTKWCRNVAPLLPDVGDG